MNAPAAQGYKAFNYKTNNNAHGLESKRWFT